MTRVVERLLKRHARKLRPRSEPDMTGWTAQERLLHAAENGAFEALVAAAQRDEPLAMVTPEEREAELRAAGKWPEPAAAATSVTAAEPEQPPGPEPGMPPPKPQWWEERAYWRPRGPRDYDWSDDEKPTLPRCIHEYDAMCWHELGPPDEEVAY